MHQHPIFHVITGFAGQGVILPIVVTVAAILVLAGQRRAAFWWTASIGLALFLTLVAKIVFIPCGHMLPSLNLRSPSGHSASAVAVYGSLSVLLMRLASRPSLKVAAIAGGLFVALAIAVSRVVLGAHTPSEAVFGAVIGCSAPLILLTRDDLVSPSLRPRWIWLLVAPILLVLLLHNVELDAERRIDGVAQRLALLTGVCEA